MSSEKNKVKLMVAEPPIKGKESRTKDDSKQTSKINKVEKPKSNKTPGPNGVFMSFQSYHFTQNIAKNGRPVVLEKQIQVLNKNGKVSGKYQEKKDGKITKEKHITKPEDVKRIGK